MNERSFVKSEVDDATTTLPEAVFCGAAIQPVIREFLKAYLDRFAPTVQRYFPIPRDSPSSAFAPIAEHYPTFELR
jgi:hypothetical protein